MAMTLRLTEAEDEALTRVAERKGISKQEAIRQAVRAYTAEQDRVDKIARKAIERYGPVLDKLK
jgi:hypothetical protein